MVRTPAPLTGPDLAQAVCVCVCVCACVCVWSRPTHQPWPVFSWEDSLSRSGSSMKVGWCKLALGPPGPGDKSQRAHNTLGQEHTRCKVPGTKSHSGGESMVPTGYQEGPGCSKTTCSRPSGPHVPVSSSRSHVCRALKEGASKAARLLWALCFLNL